MLKLIVINVVNKLKKQILKPWGWFKKQGIKKKIFSITAIIIGIIVLLSVFRYITQPAPYTTDKVTRDEVTETVSETGNITSGGISNIYSPTNGVITNVLVSNGSYVSKGDDLFSVQSSATEQEVEAARSNYLAAVASLNSAQSTANTLRASMYSAWKSFTDLATNGTYESGGNPNTENRKAAEFQESQDTWLAAEKKYKDQQTVISQAAASVNSALLAYNATQDSTVKSPIDGLVTNVSVTDESAVKTNLPTDPQTPVLVVTKGETFEIVVPIGETDIAKVRPGQRVKIDVDAVTNKSYNGVVERVDSVGTKISGVITYNVYIKILNPDSSLRAGMSVDTTITTKSLSNVLTVPNSAVKPYQGGRAVRVPGKKRGQVEYVPVTIGIKGAERTQIIKGLSDGQTIVVSLSNEQIKRPGLFGS